MEFASFSVELAQASVNAGRTLTGYASAFDYAIPGDATGQPGMTTYIRKGAFTKTLKERQPQVLFNHGFDPQIGEKPLGVPSVMRQDDRGLYVEVPLDDTSYNADIIALLRSGALRAMSIAFEAVQDDYSRDGSERNIRQVRLYEFGPVTFPANEGAQAALHSAGGFARWLGAGTSPEPVAQSPVTIHQAGPSGDPDRTTWTLDAIARSARHQADVETEAARIAAIRGRQD